MESKLAEGKTKIILPDADNPLQVLIRSKDAITAGDGARRDVMEGKGRLSTATTCHVFEFLGREGIDVAFVRPVDPITFLARRCDMVAIEVVTRRLATGSYLKRHPHVHEGKRFDPPEVEFFIKDDANHDPQILPEQLILQGILDGYELGHMTRQSRRIFELLEAAWAGRGVVLVDMKVEYGRHLGVMLLADVIDNDSWRLWPGGDKARMKDKQVYRNLEAVTPEALQEITENYAWVAEETARFLEVKPEPARRRRAAPKKR